MKKETKLSISQVFVYLVLLFVFVFFSVLTKTFLSTKNLLNICRQVSMTGICAVGMTMVLLTGGIDISIGSIIALSGVVSAKLINDLGFGIFRGHGFLHGLCYSCCLGRSNQRCNTGT